MSFSVAFKRPRNSLIESAIAFFDKGEFCHAEILDFDGAFTHAFAANAWIGCHWDGSDDVLRYSDDWVIVPVKADREKMRAAIAMATGDEYDYIGIVRFLARWCVGKLPRPIAAVVFRIWKWPCKPSAGRWFCSELVAKLLTVSDGPKFKDDYLIGPCELYSLLTGKTHA